MMPSEIEVQSIGPDALRDVLMQAGDILDAGVLHVDRELVVRGWNNWLEAASGRSSADVLGRPLLELFPELQGSGALAVFRRVFAGETVIMAQRFHGYLLPFAYAGEGFDRMQQSVRVVPHGEGDVVTGAIAFIQDVTERVRREDDLRNATARAEAANHAKSEFLAAMSHELRTPLNVIIGYADLLESDVGGSLSPRHREQVSRIRSTGWHLVGIIEEILTFSRVEAGKEKIGLESVDVAGLTHDAIELMKHQAAAKKLALDVCTPSEPVIAVTDPLKLRQILLNLIGNAVKFTSRGEVKVELIPDGDVFTVAVQDTGPGIPEKSRERIFEPFTQLDSVAHSQARAGTGLGLPISRRLAHLLGGELSLTSEQGKGSRFALTLPIAGPPPQPSTPEEL
jgi:PAS domain S-box-containing protein